jgi:hypothetical protein
LADANASVRRGMSELFLVLIANQPAIITCVENRSTVNLRQLNSTPGMPRYRRPGFRAIILLRCSMLINALEGIVENGEIRLREKVSLPENSRVYVIVADEHIDRLARPNDRAARIGSPRLAHPKQAKDFHKQIVAAPDAKV